MLDMALGLVSRPRYFQDFPRPAVARNGGTRTNLPDRMALKTAAQTTISQPPASPSVDAQSGFSR